MSFHILFNNKHKQRTLNIRCAVFYVPLYETEIPLIGEMYNGQTVCLPCLKGGAECNEAEGYFNYIRVVEDADPYFFYHQRVPCIPYRANR